MSVVSSTDKFGATWDSMLCQFDSQVRPRMVTIVGLDFDLTDLCTTAVSAMRHFRAIGVQYRPYDTGELDDPMWSAAATVGQS